MKEEHLAAARAYLARRRTLDAEVRVRVARQLSESLRGQVGGSTDTQPDRFLEGVVAAKDARDRAL